MEDKRECPMLVGIGASAGGLKALSALLAHLAPGDRATYVVAQHLSPTQKSMLVALLQKHCALKVREARHDMRLQPGTVYVTPPNRDIEIQQMRIRLEPPLAAPSPKPSVNRLFTSLARHDQSQVVGVVLSGTGSDGALGLLNIKSAGGVTLVQLPATAEYDGMPQAAIQAGASDLSVAPEEVGDVLRSYLSLEAHLQEGRNEGSQSLKHLLEQIYQISQLDLRAYKETTLERRVRRRMSIARCSTLERYLGLLKSDKKELEELVKDIFINVTEFFRDPEVWTKIASHLRDALADCGRSGRVFRAWVAGCSSGEEAYSVAILLDEINQSLPRPLRYQVFATDVSPDVIRLARSASYELEAMKDVSPARRHRYFSQSGKRFSVNASLRDRVIFSEHNVVQNVPFLNIDLLVCRNLLIYFNTTLQEQVFKTFTHSLADNGLLLLGKSESVQKSGDLYHKLDDQVNLYRCIRRAHNHTLSHYLPRAGERPPTTLMPPSKTLRQQSRVEQMRMKLYAQISHDFAPSAMLLDPAGDIAFLIGDARRYLSVNDGPPTLHFVDAIASEYSSGLQAFYYRAQRGEPVERVRLVTLQQVGSERPWVAVTIRPFEVYSKDWKVIYFHESPAPHHSTGPRSKRNMAGKSDDEEQQLINTLEGELAFTRESLQSALEALEIANKELQSTNEELQSANEELQATNEELRTFGDEMQSKNLEVLERKNRELEHLYSDIDSILQSASIPLVVVNRSLEVTRLSPELAQLLQRAGIAPVECGEQLAHVPFLSNSKRLYKIRQIMDQRCSKSFEIKINQAFYQVTVNPYGDDDGNVSGAVITLLFISEEELRRTLDDEQRATEKLLSSVESAIIRVDANGLVEYMNRRACLYAGSDAEQAQGKSLDRVLRIYNANGSRELNLPLRVQEGSGSFQFEQPLMLKIPKGREARVECSVSEVCLRDADEPSFIITMYDVSEREAIMQTLKWENTHDTLTRLFNRDEILRRVKSAIQCAYQEGQPAVFVYLDLDHFKVINDALGHSVGDKVLKDLSTLMLRQLRGVDVLGRLGGDEFGLLLEDTQLEDAILVVKKLIHAVTEFRYVCNSKAYTLGLSAGLVLINEAGPDESSQVLSQADQAMYQVKTSGGNSYRTFNPNQLEHGIPSLSRKINNALVNDEFVLEYQPIYCAKTHEVMAWEELVRLKVAGEESLLEPNKFMHLASRYGLLNRIDVWVLQQVYHLLDDWHQRFDSRAIPQVSVNLSGQTLSSHQYLERILALFDQNPSTYHSLRIEITEENAISNHAVAHAFLRKIRARGGSVWLDDFGSGVNSFTSLKTLDIDGIKIDGSFVRDMENSETDRLMVESMVRIAKSMGIRVVAEFVEAPSLKPILYDLGVDELQGFHLGKPMSERDLAGHMLGYLVAPKPPVAEHRAKVVHLSERECEKGKNNPAVASLPPS